MHPKQITFEHPELGVITVNQEVPPILNELIGTIIDDYEKFIPYYNAFIGKCDDGTYALRKLRVIEPEGIDIGYKHIKNGSTSFVRLLTNKEIDGGDDITVYPASIHTVIN